MGDCNKPISRDQPRSQTGANVVDGRHTHKQRTHTHTHTHTHARTVKKVNLHGAHALRRRRRRGPYTPILVTRRRALQRTHGIAHHLALHALIARTAYQCLGRGNNQQTQAQLSHLFGTPRTEPGPLTLPLRPRMTLISSVMRLCNVSRNTFSASD